MFLTMVSRTWAGFSVKSAFFKQLLGNRKLKKTGFHFASNFLKMYFLQSAISLHCQVTSSLDWLLPKQNETKLFWDQLFGVYLDLKASHQPRPVAPMHNKWQSQLPDKEDHLLNWRSHIRFNDEFHQERKQFSLEIGVYYGLIKHGIRSKLICKTSQASKGTF